MIKIKNIMISTIVILLLISLIGIVSADGNNGSSTMSADRTIPSDCIEPNTEFTIMVNTSNYGTDGGVKETLCDGWTYKGSSLKKSDVKESGNTVTFYLFGEKNFTYTVQAPSDEDECCTISGILTNLKNNSRVDVGEISGKPVCTCSSSSNSNASSTSTAQPTEKSTVQPTEKSTVQPTEKSTVQPTDISTESPTDASAGGSGDSTIKETTDNASEEPTIPGFTTMTMLIVAVIGIMFRSSTKK